MSDTSYTTAPAESAPPPNEVTIPDQAPNGGTGETGVQTPSKSPEQIATERALARRESIERAYAKAKAEAETRAKEPDAKAKPDEQTREKPVQKAGEKPVERPPQPRDRGRFVAAQPEAGQTVDKPGQQPVERAPLPETAPYREAPPRFSDAAKADWHGVPESVRGATTQAFEQYERGIQQYRGAAEAFHQVRDYHERAVRAGTDLPTVLANYTGMEHRLRNDLYGGLELITHNLGMQHPDGRPVSFYDVAAAYLNTSPEQRRLTQQSNNTHAQHAQIGQLYQTVQGLAQNLQQMQYQQRFQATRSWIDQFADSHPGFDERSDLIKQELDHGYPLDVAYDRAMKLRPGNGSTHAAQTRNTSAQTREEMDRSISGAPSNGSLASRPAPKKSGSNAEALRNALRRVKSGV